MTDLNPESALSVRPDLTAVEVDGEIVVYDDRRRRLHRLNPSATMLWNCLDGHATLAEIARDIADELNADSETVLSDIVSLAGALASEGLLVGTEDPPKAASSVPGSGEESPFVAEGGSACMDRSFPRGAQSSMTVGIGSKLIGIRLSTPELEHAALSVLRPSVVEGVDAPANLSVVLTSARSGTAIYWSYVSGRLAARTRGLQGAIRSVVDLLSAYDDGGADEGLVRIETVVATRDGQAVLLCPESRVWVPGLYPRLRSEGWQVHDSPWAHLDPIGGEVVIRPPSVAFDEAELRALPSHRLDGEGLLPGRYPVTAWVAPPQEVVDTSTAAGQLVGVAAESPDLHRDAAQVFRTVSNFIGRVAWRVAAAKDMGSFARLVSV